MTKKITQKGNALFLILIAVALFALLSYAVTQSGRGSGSANKEQAILDSAAIVSYVGEMQQAVNRMLLTNKCTDTNISFQNTTVAGYTNPTSPSDNSCNLFAPEGGGMVVKPMPARAFASGTAGSFFFPNISCASGIGTACDNTSASKDMMVGYTALSNEVCAQINRSLGIPPIAAAACLPIGNTGDSSQKFVGTYFGGGVHTCYPSSGHMTACVSGTNSGNTFYYVLISR